ncbi:MAG TPA: hypothetical protein VLO07_09720 [Thermoanaerobaculia bacterium]|nr:hypothetical protein [Thermoanaerobaculia bacterium]
MEIDTGSFAVASVNADRSAPDLAEAFSSFCGEETDDLPSECALTMLVGESGPTTLVVLDLPPGLQLGDEDLQPREE